MASKPIALPKEPQTDPNATKEKQLPSNGIDANGSSTTQKNSSFNGTNGSTPLSDLYYPPAPDHLLPKLPTFPPEYGYRMIYDEETGKHHQVSLTLRDLLFPTEDDVGVVKMAQGMTHEWLNDDIADRLKLHKGGQGWYFPSDVLIHWDVPGVIPKAPDVAAIPNVGTISREGNTTYHVNRDGPLPAAVIEITSLSTRIDDFDIKIPIYASVGIKEYLIIDTLTPQSEPWRLYGYRLGSTPYYDEITPDTEGGIELQQLGVRFVVNGRHNVDLFDTATGELLKSGEEYQALATEAEERAKSERSRADEAEERARAAEDHQKEQAATIAELMARLKAQESDQNPSEESA